MDSIDIYLYMQISNIYYSINHEPTEEERDEISTIIGQLYTLGVDIDRQREIDLYGCSFYFSIPEFFLENEEKKSYKKERMKKIKEYLIDLSCVYVDKEYKETYKEDMRKSSTFYVNIRYGEVYTPEKYLKRKEDISHCILPFPHASKKYEKL